MIYHVAQTGSNSNDGTTLALAKEHIPNGVALCSAGDTCYVHAGTYTGSENMLISSAMTINGGTSYADADAITIAALLGETVILQPGGGIGGEVIQLLTSTQQYIIFSRIILDGTGMADNAFGFYHQGGSHHIKLVDCIIRNFSGHGVHSADASTGFLWLLRTDVQDNGIAADPHRHNIYLTTSDNIIDGCELSGSAGCGVVLYSATLEPSRNLIQNCLIHDNASYSESDISISGGADNVVRNNFVYGDGPGAGLFIGFATPSGTLVYNNTFVHDGGIYVDTDASGTLIKNNIVRNAANSGPGPITDTGSGTVQTTNLTSDPSFVNAPLFDFRIQGDSAAKDAGTTLASVTTDYFGVSRPQGAAYDIGAHEFEVAQAAGTKQVHVWGGAAPSTQATGNNWICGRMNGSSQTIPQPLCVGVTMRNWYLNIDTAPGVGKSRTYIIQKGDGGAVPTMVTAFSITIADLATSGSALGTDVHFDAGEVTRMVVTESGAPAAGGAHRYRIEFEPDVPGTYIYGYQVSAGAEAYHNPFGGSAAQWTTNDFEYASTMGLPGTITALAHRERTAPGVGNSWDLTPLKNGVAQDGGGGTVDARCIITGTAVQTIATFSLPVVPGDSIGLLKDSTGTPAASSWQCGTLALVPDNPDQYNFHTTLAGMPNPGPEFGGIGQSASGNDWVASESAVSLYGHGTEILYFEALRLELKAAPGAGKSRTVTLYKNGSPTGLFATVADDDTVAVGIISTPIAITGADLFSLAATSAGTPAVGSAEARVSLGYGTAIVESETDNLGWFPTVSIGGGPPFRAVPSGFTPGQG